jgi:hypothetical protein
MVLLYQPRSFWSFFWKWSAKLRGKGRLWEEGLGRWF